MRSVKIRQPRDVARGYFRKQPQPRGFRQRRPSPDERRDAAGDLDDFGTELRGDLAGRVDAFTPPANLRALDRFGQGTRVDQRAQPTAMVRLLGDCGNVGLSNGRCLVAPRGTNERDDVGDVAV